MSEQRAWKWMPGLMQERQHQFIIWGGVGCLLVLALLAVVGERGFLDVYEFSRYLERVEHQIQAVEAENIRLREQVMGLRYDSQQIEKMAREELGLVRPDEVIFAIVGTSDAP